RYSWNEKFSENSTLMAEKSKGTTEENCKEHTEAMASAAYDVEAKLLKFQEDFISELHAASTLMSNLQTEVHILSKRTEEIRANQEKLARKVKALNRKIQSIVEKMNTSSNKETLPSQMQVDLMSNTWDTLHTLEVHEFLCKTTGQMDVQCVQDCPHIIGHHEQQISEGGESDLHQHLADCKKNPGHTNFIPVDTFSVQHLPERHQDIELYTFIKAAADLTVKISVTMTSLRRPDFWPNTNVPYFLYSMKGSQHLRTGSGAVIDVFKWTTGTCKCHKCQHSDKRNIDCWKIQVNTAANLVFDDIEARHTYITLFYDTEDGSNVVKLSAVEDFNKDITRDVCRLDFVTCDRNLAAKLDLSLKKYYERYNKATERYRTTRDEDKVMFHVSHPHGCCKRISVGQWKDKIIFRNSFNRFTYSVATCPGCSGASDYFLGNGWHSHCGVLNCGLGYSSA
ncbi:STE20 serine/threonine-protein kinase isoform X2, partial [Biomphalaria glabrata]